MKCKKCGVPLTGVLSHLPRILFGIKPGREGCCNKCECTGPEKTVTAKKTAKNKKSKKR